MPPMAVCAKAVCWGGVEMKLHRVLLAACMNCTRRYLPFSGNLYPKRPFGSASAFSSGLGETRTLKYTVPLGNTELASCSRSYSDSGSRCQLRKPQSVAVRKENLLQGGATWPGKHEIIELVRSTLTRGDLTITGGSHR